MPASAAVDDEKEKEKPQLLLSLKLTIGECSQLVTKSRFVTVGLFDASKTLVDTIVIQVVRPETLNTSSSGYVADAAGSFEGNVGIYHLRPVVKQAGHSRMMWKMPAKLLICDPSVEDRRATFKVAANGDSTDATSWLLTVTNIPIKMCFGGFAQLPSHYNSDGEEAARELLKRTNIIIMYQREAIRLNNRQGLGAAALPLNLDLLVPRPLMRTAWNQISYKKHGWLHTLPPQREESGCPQSSSSSDDAQQQGMMLSWLKSCNTDVVIDPYVAWDLLPPVVQALLEPVELVEPVEPIAAPSHSKPPAPAPANRPVRTNLFGAIPSKRSISFAHAQTLHRG